MVWRVSSSTYLVAFYGVETHRGVIFQFSNQTARFDTVVCLENRTVRYSAFFLFSESYGAVGCIFFLFGAVQCGYPQNNCFLRCG